MRPEDTLQAEVVKFLEENLPLACWFTASANGAWFGGTKLQRIKQAQRMKRTGVKAGTPDLIFCHETRFLSIELKVEGEYATDVQNEAEDKIAIAGGGYAVCRSVQDVEETLLAWEVPLRGSAARKLSTGLSTSPLSTSAPIAVRETSGA